MCVVLLWQWSLQRWWWQFKLRVFWSMMMAMQWWYSWSREWRLWLRVVLSTALLGRASFKSWRSRSVQTGRPATAKRRRMPGYQRIREAVKNPGHKPHVFTLMKHYLWKNKILSKKGSPDIKSPFIFVQPLFKSGCLENKMQLRKMNCIPFDNKQYFLEQNIHQRYFFRRNKKTCLYCS